MAINAWPQFDTAELHTLFDSCVMLTNAVLALLLWDIAARSTEVFPKLLAVCFVIAGTGELAHVLFALNVAAIDVPSGLDDVQWRAGTWGTPALVLPISVLAALWAGRMRRANVLVFGLVAIAVAGLAWAFFLNVPRYSPPGVLGITRPTLICVPLLWIAIGYFYWRVRSKSEVYNAIALMALIMVLAHVAMLYSRSPADAAAMTAHLGKLIAKLFLLINLMQIGAAAMVQQLEAERGLHRLNQELELRVDQRTGELKRSNAALAQENALRSGAERKLQRQVMRLNLLHQITRAIAQRQDLESILNVAVSSLEDQLPVDFACVLQCGAGQTTLLSIGAKSHILSAAMGITKHGALPTDLGFLARCLEGHLVHQPDLAVASTPLQLLLAGAGLRAAVASPLMIEKEAFGILLTARRVPTSFSSGECEFLRQLSEHVALAARQALLHGKLQNAYDDLRHSQEAAVQQERLAAIGQMASGIAHDINNAISPVSLYTDKLLESDISAKPEIRSYLSTVRRVIDDVSATVSRMREFYRDRSSNGDQDRVAVDLNEMIQQVVAFTQARWGDIPQRSGITIAVKQDLAKNLPAALCVAHEIREVLTNLIFNAVDALPKGGKISIKTSAVERRSPGGTVTKSIRLDVCDTGIGMDDATRQRCLEPFFTTKGERGTGLGLAMVHGALSRHGADLEIISAPGKGTTMRLTIPLAGAVETHEAAASVADASAPPMRILVVDDDPFVLDSLSLVLEMDGHTVIQAEGGQAGIDTFQADRANGADIRVVITDLGMPYVDGGQVSRAIKHMSPATPIVLLTGWGRAPSADRDTSVQVDFTLAKPPQLAELREVLLLCSQWPAGAVA